MLLTTITTVRSFSVHMKTAVSDFTPQRLFYTAKAHFLILPIPWLHISMIISTNRSFRVGLANDTKSFTTLRGVKN